MREATVRHNRKPAPPRRPPPIPAWPTTRRSRPIAIRFSSGWPAPPPSSRTRNGGFSRTSSNEPNTPTARSSKRLLPVIDNFERALTVDPAKTDTVSVLKGLQIVHDQLMSVLRQQQVEEIAPPAGTPFDSSRHEALMQQDSIYKTPTVVQLMQKGYALHGRTLRPAQVAVSKSAG